MYAFRQRSDTVVFDEPLYGHYLKTSGAEHPGREEVLAAMDCNGPRVVDTVLLAPVADKRVRFYKNMAHHVRELDNQSFLRQLTNVLLTRDPEEMLPSLAEQLPDPTLNDTGLPEQVALLERIQAAGGEPLVLDAREVLLDPESVLRQLCGRLTIPFEAGMLRWPSGPKPEDGVWARHWYDSVHASTGFEPYHPKEEPFPERLRPLLKQCRPFYERLYVHALRAE